MAAWNYGIANANACGFFIQACFCPWLHSSYRSNAYIFFVVGTRKYPSGMARLRVAQKTFLWKQAIANMSVVWLIVAGELL